MPLSKKKDGWYWGGRGPYKNKAQAQSVAKAVYSKKGK